MLNTYLVKKDRNHAFTVVGEEPFEEGPEVDHVASFRVMINVVFVSFSLRPDIPVGCRYLPDGLPNQPDGWDSAHTNHQVGSYGLGPQQHNHQVIKAIDIITMNVHPTLSWQQNRFAEWKELHPASTLLECKSALPGGQPQWPLGRPAETMGS